jgi:hypothetical protein
MPVNLQKTYDFINKKYYKGKLPKITLRYAKTLPIKGPAIGCTTYLNSVPEEIIILDCLKDLGVFCIQTVLHEIAHVYCGKRAGHGKRFKEELLRLHKAGAYEGLL